MVKGSQRKWKIEIRKSKYKIGKFLREKQNQGEDTPTGPGAAPSVEKKKASAEKIKRAKN
jgi:hypothetical protein